MTQHEHPMPGPSGWWASFDGGEHLELGPFDTRDDVIEEALEDGRGDTQLENDTWVSVFEICRAQDNHVDLSVWVDDNNLECLLDNTSERLDENGSGSDEDGDRHPLEGLTLELKSDLFSRIRAAVREWQRTNKLPLRSYWFNDTSNHETISIPLKPEEVG